MLDASRTADVLHLGSGLYGAWTHVVVGDLGGSIMVALTVAASVLILAGAFALAEVARVKVRQFARKHEPPRFPEPRDKGD
jgi:hypothetical protein